jgi:acyl carrier protein
MMTNTGEIRARVREILTASLGQIDTAADVTQEAHPAWDSMKHMEIMLMLEESFGVTFEPDDFTEMVSLERCVQRIAARIGTPGG